MHVVSDVHEEKIQKLHSINSLSRAPHMQTIVYLPDHRHGLDISSKGDSVSVWIPSAVKKVWLNKLSSIILLSRVGDFSCVGRILSIRARLAICKNNVWPLLALSYVVLALGGVAIDWIARYGLRLLQSLSELSNPWNYKSFLKLIALKSWCYEEVPSLLSYLMLE